MTITSDQKNFEAIFYGSEIPMVIFKGPDMIVEKHNSKYHEIYHNRDLQGQSLFTAVPELKDSPFPGILKKIYEGGEPVIRVEGLARIINIHTGLLEERYFDTSFSRIIFDNEFHILAVPKEVTKRVEARKNLEASLKELKEERELREKFVSALSHDLRTPLAIVTMCALILKKSIDEADTVVEMADRITSSVARADRMIHNLLDASRIKAGLGIPLSIQEFELDECVKSVITDLEELYGARFKVVNTSGVIKGFWDNIGIHRILENLVSNAVKYGTPNSIITINLLSSENEIEIQVHNEGSPILEDERLELFNQYSRSKSAENSGLIGWGIGLSLIKGLTEAHHGSVFVHSTLEEGTTFTVKMPRDSRESN